MENDIIAKMMAGEDFDENAAEIINRESAEAAINAAITPLPQFPAYVPEEQNRNVLIKGRWLERGGSAWFVSTAGTGKSIHSLQLSLSLVAGVEFGGLKPNIVNDKDGNPPPPMKIWICQTEDSPTRVTIDREDVIAELTETYPEIDWKAAAQLISFVDLGGKTGVDAIDMLDRLLQAAKTTDIMPDILILNPFMAFVGGPVCDSTYVTPFLRGGEINHKKTTGLQGLITKHQIGLLVYHHTPKPPAPKEIESWMNDGFGEYKGAGSSDITNWGRSFITMFKDPKDRKRLILVAGKNGSELNWIDVGGVSKNCIAWSGKKSAVVNGALRHAWRELTPEEMAEFAHDADAAFQHKVDNCINRALEIMHGGRAFYGEEFRKYFTNEFGQKVASAAWVMLDRHSKADELRYQITRIPVGVKRIPRKYIGYADGIAKAKEACRDETRLEESNGEQERLNAENDEFLRSLREGNESAKG